MHQIQEIALENDGAALYLGQVDEDNEPNGIGRLISPDGSITEGQLTMDTSTRKIIPDGFVRIIDSHQQIFTWSQNGQ